MDFFYSEPLYNSDWCQQATGMEFCQWLGGKMALQGSEKHEEIFKAVSLPPLPHPTGKYGLAPQTTPPVRGDGELMKIFMKKLQRSFTGD